MSSVLKWSQSKSLFLALSLILGAASAQATSTDTLPEGVRNTQIRAGFVSGLDQTWAANSQLYYLGDTKSVQFDAATLARVNQEAKDLVQALDYVGRQGIGSKISLGTLNVATKPELQYYAPIAAYGYSPNITIAVGLPVLRYTNQIQLSSTDSNLDFYRDQFGGITDKIDAALNIDLVKEAEKVLAAKGYRALEDRKESYIGDLQIAVLRKLPNYGDWTALHHMTLTLPTGPQYDPDDLMAVNNFGRTSIENTVIAGRPIKKNWSVYPMATLLIPIPDKVVKRVPRNNDDLLPDQSSKQSVLRLIGPSATVGADVSHDLTHIWTISAGSELTIKSRDFYAGSGRTDLLSKHTDSYVQKVRARLSYSTIESFKRKESVLPSKIVFQISDTILGRNVERQLLTELTAMIFF